MSSVLATLLDNAVKYSIGRADIRISAEEKEKASAIAEASIKLNSMP